MNDKQIQALFDEWWARISDALKDGSKTNRAAYAAWYAATLASQEREKALEEKVRRFAGAIVEHAYDYDRMGEKHCHFCGRNQCNEPPHYADCPALAALSEQTGEGGRSE